MNETETETGNSMKKNKLTSVCQNILMVCGAVTALTGAVGGIKETFFKGGDKPDGGSEGGSTIIIEQRVQGSGENGGSVKTIHVENGNPKVIVRPVHVPETITGISVGRTPASESSSGVADSQVAGSAAPEVKSAWSGVVASSWGRILSIGLVLMGLIVLIDKFVLKHKVEEKINEHT